MKVRLEKYNTLLFLLLVIFTGGCAKLSSEKHQGADSFILRGKLRNKNSGMVYLSQSRGKDFVVCDSALVRENGNFKFTGKFEGPDIYQVSISPQNKMLLVIDIPQIEVSADANNLQKTGEIRDSKENELLQELINAVEKKLEKISNLEKLFIAARKAGKTDSIPYYQEKYLTLKSENTQTIMDFIRSNPDSFVASYAAFSMVKKEDNAEFLDSMLMVFNKEMADSKFVKLLNEQITDFNSLAVGSLAPDFTLPQPDGTSLTLSSLNGKYTLLDFWASWCRPCREENPMMVKLFNRYKKNGFEILGISLDQSKDQWVKAIEKDRLPWHQVSDLKGMNSIAVQLYNVQDIPLTILLNEEGRIIAINLRGAALEEKLTELFP